MVFSVFKIKGYSMDFISELRDKSGSRLEHAHICGNTMLYTTELGVREFAGIIEPNELPDGTRYLELKLYSNTVLQNVAMTLTDSLELRPSRIV